MHDEHRTGGAEPQTERSERVWLTYAQASARTGLHSSSLWRATRQGSLRVGGTPGAPRFHMKDIDEFMRHARSGLAER